jgi:tetratricopeptide (TPR) repeat protein
MRILILSAWLLLVPVALAYHFGPGQTEQKLDTTAKMLAEAQRLAAAEDYAAAVEAFNDALKLLPDGHTEQARKIRLQRAKAQMLGKQLPEAHADLVSLVDDLSEDAAADPKLVAEARATLANSQYYLTWLMRLEGLGRDIWEPEIESARQIYRHLAEEARGDPAAAKTHLEDLESTIRLARMDLSELQGLALPCQCKGCCSGKCKSRGKSRPLQLQKTDIRSAGSGNIPDTGGR